MSPYGGILALLFWGCTNSQRYHLTPETTGHIQDVYPTYTYACSTVWNLFQTAQRIHEFQAEYFPC